MAEVETTREGAVLTITLNRPDVLNAFNGALHEQLGRALDEAADPAVRAVVITGAGRGFCVGQDLAEFGGNRDVAEMLRTRYQPNVEKIRALEKPVIAAVNGPAAGAGLSLACACDVRIAGESASFVPAFIGIGLIPDAGGSYFVQRLLGYARAFEWMTSGHKLTAPEARDWGLVSAVVPDAELAHHAAQLADRYAHMPTRGIAGTKRLFDHAETATLEQQLALEARLQGELAQTPDFHEGVAAFREKREPQFTGQPRETHPVELVVADDRRRWRLTVLVRQLLAYPHLAVVAGWGIVALLVAVVGWFVVLVRGRLPERMHDFVADYVRYSTRVTAYLYFIADPYPSFRANRDYPIDVVVAPPRPQSRWKTAFRIVLAVPALVFVVALAGILYVLQYVGFVVALVLGRMPKGMRDLGAYCVRFSAQTSAYLLLLTDAYPSLASTIAPSGELTS